MRLVPLVRGGALLALLAAAPIASAADPDPDQHQLLTLDPCVAFANNCISGDLTLDTTGQYHGDSTCFGSVRVPLDVPMEHPCTPGRSVVASGSLIDRIQQGAVEWIPTQATVTSPSTLREARERCSLAAGLGNDVCSYRLKLDIHRAERVGVVRDAVAITADATAGPCQSYAACVAKSSIGLQIPVPTSAPNQFSLEHRFVAFPFADHLRAPARLEKLLAILTQDLDAVRRREPSTLSPVMLYRIRNEEDILRYLHTLRSECLAP